MGKTNIHWATNSINPYPWACNMVSPGCMNCYMFAMSAKLHSINAATVPITWREQSTREFKALKPGAVVFVNSMSDTYHERAPLALIHRIHNIARQRPNVTFLVLTKRVERAVALSPYLDYPPNLWVGVSVENADYLWRLDYLRRIPAAGRFVSFEPLLSSVKDADLSGIGWVIAGGESGPNRRYFDKSWAVELRDLCVGKHITFMFKQGSAHRPGQDTLLNGVKYEGIPTAFSAGWLAHKNAEPAQLPMF
jgi:protein gp37